MAAITRQLTGDISSLTIAGTDYKASASNVKIEAPATLVEGRGITYRGENPQVVDLSVLLSTTQLSVIDACTRVAGIDVSAFTLGGVSYISYLLGGSLSGSYSFEELGGVGDAWLYPMPMIPKYTATVQLAIPNSATANAVQDFLAGFMNATIATAIADRQVALSITINGVAVTIPMMVQNAVWTGEDGKKQVVTLSLQGKDCNTGTYPAAPTGSTSLLEKAFVAPQTPITCTFVLKSSNSASFTGTFVYDSFGFSFNKSALVSTDYSWRSHGVIAPTTN